MTVVFRIPPRRRRRFRLSICSIRLMSRLNLARIVVATLGWFVRLRNFLVRSWPSPVRSTLVTLTRVANSG